MGVDTIADLAALGKEADEAVQEAALDNGFRERPSAPAQLLPGITGAIGTSVRFATFVRDVELRELRFKANSECVVPLPISSKMKHPGSIVEILEAQKCPIVRLGYISTTASGGLTSASVSGRSSTASLLLQANPVTSRTSTCGGVVN